MATSMPHKNLDFYCCLIFVLFRFSDSPRAGWPTYPAAGKHKWLGRSHLFTMQLSPGNRSVMLAVEDMTGWYMILIYWANPNRGLSGRVYRAVPSDGEELPPVTTKRNASSFLMFSPSQSIFCDPSTERMHFYCHSSNMASQSVTSLGYLGWLWLSVCCKSTLTHFTNLVQITQ